MFRVRRIFCFAGFFVFALFSSAFPQATEQLVVTTYYPSPSGSYRYLAVGQNVNADDTDYNLQILRNGTLGQPGTFDGVPALLVQDISGDGPAAIAPLVSINAPRIGDGDGNAANALLVSVRNDSGTAFAVTGQRRVGILTSTPSYTLDVIGQVRTTNDSPLKPNAGGWSAYSDKRLKKNIKPLINALDEISKLQAVTYEWINPELHVSGVRAGVIGQDLQEVFPDWVSKTKPEGKDKELIPEGEDALVIAFPADFNAYLIEAVKELKRENDALRARVEALETKMASGDK